jgi:cysteine desulfurase
MIYADYNGSAPICPEVRDYLIKRLETGPFANPNSIHHMGTKTLMGMENARAVCAKIVGAKPKQIIFNSGASEGISTVFYSVLKRAKKAGKTHIIISGQEHSVVINCAKRAQEEQDFQVLSLKANHDGIVDVEQLKIWLKEHGDQLALVSIMAANNETGVIQPYKEISDLCQQAQVPYVCDTTQYIGKTEFDFNKSGIDYAFMSGHKIGALTGAGFLLAKDTTTLEPLIIGGGQERNLRGGTQNYIGNETLAVALDYFQRNQDKLKKLFEKRKEFENKVKEKFPEVVILGENAPRLASSTYIALPGVHGQAVQIELESKDIFVTTSSACSDNEPVTSKVLQSMGVDDHIGRGVVRISLGLCSGPELYDEIADALIATYSKLQQIKSF